MHLERLPALLTRYPKRRAALYGDIKEGLFPRPVKIGKRACAWPSHEVDRIIEARISGASEDQLRILVAQLVAERRAQVR